MERLKQSAIGTGIVHITIAIISMVIIFGFGAYKIFIEEDKPADNTSASQPNEIEIRSIEDVKKVEKLLDGVDFDDLDASKLDSAAKSLL